MIIQVRGTSGSGKSTVVRKVMESFGEWTPALVVGRKRPLYYVSGGVAVLGHYESACGGCDTVGSAATVFELITSLPRYVVLCEGLLLSEDVKWSSQLNGLRAVFLTTPVETCLAQVRSRRAEAGNGKDLNEDNTRNRVGVIERARVRLLAAGVDCRRASADQAPELILKWLSR